jgi:hypothetical protein
MLPRLHPLATIRYANRDSLLCWRFSAGGCWIQAAEIVERSSTGCHRPRRPIPELPAFVRDLHLRDNAPEVASLVGAPDEPLTDKVIIILN